MTFKGIVDHCNPNFDWIVTPTLIEIKDVKNKLEKCIAKLKPGKAAGLDGITTREVKNIVEVFKESFSIVCAKSLATDKFPAEYKIAKLKAAEKRGTRPRGKLTDHLAW